MSRRCKAGQRARIISAGSNKGAIVVVVRAYFDEKVDDSCWPCAIYPWVVTSLGKPLEWRHVENAHSKGHSMTIVLDDCDLEPLREDDSGLSDEAEKRAPKPSAAHLPA